MSLYFYGVIAQGETAEFERIGFEINGSGKASVFTVPHRNIAAVIGPSPQKNFTGLNKEKLVKMLLAHQETLETIMKNRFILPCKFGTVIGDEKEVDEILSQNEAFLEEWLAKMKNSCELDIVATWDARQILQEIAAEDHEIIDWKKRFQLLPLDDQETEKIKIGMLLSAKLREEAKDYAKEILTCLKEVSESYVVHEVMNDEMVANASFLLAQGKEGLVFKALEVLDKRWQGKLNFKCVGPLPPYSFTTVTIKQFDSKQIRSAQTMLGLEEVGNIEQLKHAYKLKARQSHPDVRPFSNDKEFEAIKEAYELLLEYFHGGCKLIAVSLFQANKLNGHEEL